MLASGAAAQPLFVEVGADRGIGPYVQAPGMGGGGAPRGCTE